MEYYPPLISISNYQYKPKDFNSYFINGSTDIHCGFHYYICQFISTSPKHHKGWYYHSQGNLASLLKLYFYNSHLYSSTRSIYPEPLIPSKLLQLL